MKTSLMTPTELEAACKSMDKVIGEQADIITNQNNTIMNLKITIGVLVFIIVIGTIVVYNILKHN